MAKKHFKAESKRLLDLMINSIYTNREIFLREIISNSSDAIDKLHYVSLTDENARKLRKKPQIKISVSKENRTVTVTDNGIGMTAEELENNLGTICKSGSLDFKNDLSEADAKKAVDIIGQFGVGFYSAFMVADYVTVTSKSYKEETSHVWQSSGADGYSITDGEKTDVGTEIVMHLKDDTDFDKYSEFLEEYRIKNLVKTYSDYIRYPIVMDCEKRETEGEGENAKTVTTVETETLNSMKPIWQKAKKDIKKEDSDKFYKDTFYDYENPLFTVSVAAEGVVSYKALLFIPAKAPYDYFTKDYKKGLKLYSSGVMIMENCEDLLPEHFRFVKGVVDTDDLSLNISREMLQKNNALNIIAQNLEKKIKAELTKALKNDRENYEKFYKAFGLQLKYATVSDFGMNKDKVKDLLLFWSGNENKLVTVEEYVQKMPEEQKHIYFACGESAAKINALPQAERVFAKGYDMLCLTDDVDEFVMQSLAEYEGKDFCSINSDNADLTDETEADAAKKAEEENKDLLAFIKEKTGVAEVIISQKLKSHPVCLSAKGNVTLEMEKHFANMPGNDNTVKAERVLEINANHKAFLSVKDAYKSDKEKAEKMAKVLYGAAVLTAGLPLENPSELADAVCDMF